MGWFIVYLLANGINAGVLISEDIRIDNPKYWVSFGCVVLAYFAGRYGG